MLGVVRALEGCDDRSHFHKFQLHVTQSALFLQCILNRISVIFIKQTPQPEDGVFPGDVFFIGFAGVGNCLPQYRPFTQQQPIEGDTPRLSDIYA